MDERLYSLEKKIEIVLQSQETTTRNIDNLTKEVRLLIGANGQWKLIEAKASSAHKRIDRLESSLIWATRMIVGAVILAVIGLVVKTGG